MNTPTSKIADQQEIVVVDDTLSSLQFLADILQKHGYKVRPVSSPALALETVAAKLPDLILLDVKMPEMDGYEVCRRLKADIRSRTVPVIFISAYSDTVEKIKGFEAGGVDFITKPFKLEEVLARVHTHLQLYELTERLEQQVEQRTEELSRANQKLRLEIAERKRAEEILRVKDYIIESASSVIATYDLEGAMTYVNPAFLIKWGFEDVKDIYGRPFWEFWMVKDRLDEIMMTLNVEKRWSDEIEARKKDGTLFDVHVLAATVSNQAGEPVGLMSTSVDITERKRVEEQLERHRNHLEELVKERTSELTIAKQLAEEAQLAAEAANEAKSDFLARMSHEIRTPLNAVTGLTNIVLKSELTEEQRDYLHKVQIASNNLLEVINDILDFSKVEAGRLELLTTPFDLNQVLEQLADLFSNRLAQKDIELVFTITPDVPRQLKGDAGRLTQVLTNLVENAVKYTETGEIVVRVKNGAEGRLAAASRHQLIFEVADSGVGIAADVLPTLFDPFIQVEGYLTRKHEGTGLGLAICRRLVELMGGRIWAKSTPDFGSTFFFTVVLEAQQKEKPRISLPPDLRGLQTLVVDDSATARQAMVGLLESFAFNVSAVDSGVQAIEALSRAEKDKPYQLVLLDWKMPGMDGIETAKAIRNNPSLHHPPVIILVTAYGRELMQKHIDRAMADTLLLKPVKPSQLLNVIMGLFGQAEKMIPGRVQKPATWPLQRLSGRRVLVVEDSELNREVAVALLEAIGLTVDIAENGQVAVDLVRESPQGYFNTVFMDIQMPVMDGYEATKKIRELELQQGAAAGQPKIKTPIIALTAHALKGEKEKCLAADMDDYLAKPLDEQELHRVLFKWVASRQEEGG